MPFFKLNRTAELAGLGHMINFRKGEKTWVPPELTQRAVGIGAERLDPEEEVADAPPAPVAPEGEARDEAFVAAFELLVSKNAREDFTGTGVPSVKAVSDIIGFAVDKAELQQRWKTFSAK
jgi:hypothetical protein